MRTTSQHFTTAKQDLAKLLDTLPLDAEQRRELSSKVAKFTAMAVREDRVKRMPHDTLAKLCDVVFNGRPA